MSGYIQRLYDRAASGTAAPTPSPVSMSGSPLAEFDQRLGSGLVDDTAVSTGLNLEGEMEEASHAADNENWNLSSTTSPRSQTDAAPMVENVTFPPRKQPANQSVESIHQTRTEEVSRTVSVIDEQSTPVEATETASPDKFYEVSKSAPAPVTPVTQLPDTQHPKPASFQDEQLNTLPERREEQIQSEKITVADLVPTAQPQTETTRDMVQTTEPVSVPEATIFIQPPRSEELASAISTAASPPFSQPVSPVQPIETPILPSVSGAVETSTEPPTRVIERIVKEVPVPMESSSNTPRGPLTAESVSKIGRLPQRRRSHTLFGHRRR